jgi:hypothetical protein
VYQQDASPLVSQLLARIDSYCARAGLSAARIATLAVNDGDFVRRLRAGGTCQISTYEKFMAWLDSREAQPEQRESAA